MHPHMPEDDRPPSHPPHVVRLYRLNKDETRIVRLLAYSPLGLMSHYVRKRSVWCTGDVCPSTIHKEESFWKGYVPVELWGDQTRLWYPAVLEVTESLELDFRDQAARGQLWKLVRPQRSKHKRSSLTGSLLEQRDPATMPMPFDVLPILRTVYHNPLLRLDVRNPMPARVALVPTAGDPPPGSDEANEEKKQPYISFAERLKQKEAMKNGHS